MKNYSHLILPAFALLTLGGCATSSGLVSSTENDGVYYSSKDKTTMTASAQQALAYNSAYNSATDQQYLRQQPSGQQQQTQQPATGDANPEYDDTNATTGRVSSAEYYDDGYNYAANLRRFSQASPYYGNYGTGYYGMAYTDPFYYGGGYSPYGLGGLGYASPFGFGSGLSIGLGFGSLYSPYGYGYRPYGLGYASPYYDPFYGGFGGYGLGSRYYGYNSFGYGGYGGYGYGAGGYGNNYGYGNADRYSNNVRSRPRYDRSSEAMSNARQPMLQSGRVNRNSMIASPDGSGNVVPNSVNNGVDYNRGRGRVVSREQQQQMQQQQNALGVPADQPNVSGNSRGSRWRMFGNNAQQPAQGQAPTQATAPANRRGRLYSADQMQQMQQRQQQQQRTYEQRPSRSFEQPSRSFSSPSSSPSFSAPSGGGGGRGRVR